MAVMRGKIVTEICVRVPHVNAGDCRVRFTHPDQLASLAQEISDKKLSWALQVSKQVSCLGKFALPVQLFKGGVLLRSVPVGIETEVLVTVVRAFKDMPKGGIFEASALVADKAPLAKVPYQAFRGVAEVVGKQARRPLRAGTLLLPWMLGEPALVNCNDPVRILMRGARFTVEAEGVAMQDGGANEWIRVRQMDGQHVLRARVLDVRQVAINVE